MNDASQKSAPTGKQGRQQKGKTKTLMGQLLDAVRLVVDPANALKAIEARFSDDERHGINNLIRFAKRHAMATIDGNSAEGDAVRRTIAFAERVGKILDDRFEAIMNDSFIIFDKAMASIRSTAPEILMRDGDKIIALQEALRKELQSGTATYDSTVEAYKAMMAYIPSVSAEAEQAAKAERECIRRDRDKELAKDVLNELNELEEI